MSKFAVLMFILVYSSCFAEGIVTNRTIGSFDFFLTNPGSSLLGHSSNAHKCSSRLHGSLEKLRRRQANLKSTAFIDLSGYALHQSLRHLPLDMYITDIRVRTPGIGDWVRIEKCQFSNRDNRMTTQILFNDLTVSGTVQLLDDNEIRKNSHPVPREFCKMSLRFQRAGLGINAFPTKARSRGLIVRTEARFLDPKFLSVHAYGCKLNDIFKREETNERNLEPSPVPKRLRFKDDPEINVPHQDRAHSIGNFARAAFSEEMDQPEVRIITLNPETRASDEPSKWYNLHNEHESDLNEFHRHRVLGMRLHTPTEREKLKAILHVQRLIAQQANHVFQTQGPFSQAQKPLFKPHKETNLNANPSGSSSVVSTITELDENLSPIRPITQRPFDSLFSHSDQLGSASTNTDFQNYYDLISREMEDIFLRGIKTLLTRYVEKQLEIPLKEALMVNFGYTVSYG